jgi:hypothetical protein
MERGRRSTSFFRSILFDRRALRTVALFDTALLAIGAETEPWLSS